MAPMRLDTVSLLGLLAPLVLWGCADDLPGAEVGDSTGETEVGDSMGDSMGESEVGETETGDGDGDGDSTGDGDGDGDPGPSNPLPDAPVGEWTYVEIDGMFCRDGSPAGIGVRYADNSDLLTIYMEGGGACFNAFTCGFNPSSIPSAKFDPGPSGGLFNNQNPDNPMMDHNFIYMPYCTGDVFFGSETNGNVPGGPQGQMFVGHDNVILALERITDTFPNLTSVVATGESGGGFGAAANYDTIASFFPDNDVILIDDSGPLFRDQYLAPCLQQQFRDVWNVDDSLPQDCSACFGADGGGLSNYLTYIQNKYPDAAKGVISSHADSTISSFFGFGSSDCNALFPSFPEFEEALYDMRDNVLTGPNSGTFFKTGTTHTYLSKDTYYNLTVNGVVLVDWVADLMNGTAAHVAP